MLKTTLATMRVTSDTTLDQLKAFQETIGKDDAKLRGTKNRDGSITLKAVDRDSSFLSKMFGISKKRRDAARSALTMVMTNSGAVDRKPTGSLKSLINADRAHSPKSAMLRDLVAFAKADSVDQFQKASESPIRKEKHLNDVLGRKFPTLEAKGLPTARVENYVKLACDFATVAPLSDDRVKEFANEIRTEIYAQLTKDGPLGQNERAMLGVSDIEGYVSAIVAQAVPLPHTENVAQAMEKIAKGVADQLSEQLLGTKQTGPDSFQIGSEVFTKVETLGQGGFGRADLYRSESTGREVVLKVPGEIDRDAPEGTQEKAQFDFKAEIDMHTKIMESAERKYPHVLSFEGAVRLPTGLFATVTEACTSGDMSKMMTKLDDAVKNGSLTADQAMTCKLTLMRDMVDGQSILFNRGFSHRDVKFQNVFINSKGVGKIADFGETAFGKSFSLSNEKIVENPLYLAPENLVANEKLATFEMKAVEHQYAHLKAKVEAYNALVGPGGVFAHLGEAPMKAETLDALPDGAERFEYSAWKNRGTKLMAQVDSRLDALGETGTLMKSMINDLTGGEAKRLQDAVDSKKAHLPTESLVNGGAADVWSFGTALLTSCLKPGQAINMLGDWMASEKLTKYFNETPAVPVNGGQPAPLPKALVVGSFLTDKFVSPHQNGTVTGDPELDDLINQCLSRDPDDRPTFAEMLKNPVFQRPGVGDTATREVIAALGTKPPKTIEDIQELAIEMAV